VTIHCSLGVGGGICAVPFVSNAARRNQAFGGLALASTIASRRSAGMSGGCEVPAFNERVVRTDQAPRRRATIDSV
jgi:hypothetical protein